MFENGQKHTQNADLAAIRPARNRHNTRISALTIFKAILRAQLLMVNSEKSQKKVSFFRIPPETLEKPA